MHNLTHSRFGRALAAIRQSETAAEAMGIDVLRYKAVAFAASGFLGAMGGGLLASLSTYLDPAQYGITQSVYFLAIAVVGGMSSSLGAVSEAPCSFFCPTSCSHFNPTWALFSRLLLLGFIVLRPEGLASLRLLRNALVPAAKSAGASR